MPRDGDLRWTKERFGQWVYYLHYCCLLSLASACSGKDTIKVTFDGNKCVLSGHSDLETGAHQISVLNSSEFQGLMLICQADKGKVWQDILDFDYGDGADSDTELEWPPWCLGFPTSSVASEESNQVVYEYNLQIRGPILYCLGTKWTRCGVAMRTIDSANGCSQK